LTTLEDKFDAGAYWRDRVVSGADLSVVGHRSMGPAYNGQIYERRLEVLDEMLLRHSDKPVEQLRVLDIGCGSGFYTAYWAVRGVVDYLGVDISLDTIEHLSSLHPDYQFLQADMTERRIAALLELPPFDAVTIFDVFYHIVDDERFMNAVEHVGSMTSGSGCVFVMDQLNPKRYQLSKHVVYRDRTTYLETFRQNELCLVDEELLFHFLVPPLTGNRFIDYLAASIFKMTGLIVGISDDLANWMATKLRRIDARLRFKGRRVSNSAMLVFQKTKGSTEA